jgi:hypothetical protein
VDIYQVQVELANALSDVITLDGKKLHCYEYVPNLPVYPAFYVAEYTIDPYMTMGGRYRVTFQTRLLIAPSTDRHAQKVLAHLLSQVGAGSIYAAFEAARGEPGQLALGGTADDFAINPPIKVQMFQIGDTLVYGADIPIEVIGS